MNNLLMSLLIRERSSEKIVQMVKRIKQAIHACLKGMVSTTSKQKALAHLIKTTLREFICCFLLQVIHVEWKAPDNEET